MKKARIVLTVILILGMSAGMLAWKANRRMAMIYYTCNTNLDLCMMTWTLGFRITPFPDPIATLTVYNATPETVAFEKDCGQWCTWSNVVYIEPGY